MVEAVALYDGVPSLFTPACVLLIRRAMKHAPTPSSPFFRTPVAGKRKNTYWNIFMVRVFSFVYFSDILLALQQRSPEVRKGLLCTVQRMNTSPLSVTMDGKRLTSRFCLIGFNVRSTNLRPICFSRA